MGGGWWVARTRLPSSVFICLRTAETLHQHQAALLGLVTHAATHCSKEVIQQDGQVRTEVLRDSSGQRPRKARTWRHFAPRRAAQQVLVETSCSMCAAGAQVRQSSVAPQEKRRRLRDLQQQQGAVADARRVACHLAATHLQPRSGPTAAQRLAEMRERVRAKEAEDQAWELERRRASAFC